MRVLVACLLIDELDACIEPLPEPADLPVNAVSEPAKRGNRQFLKRFERLIEFVA